MAEKQTTEKQSTFKELVLPVIVLVVICLVCSALLAVLNDITAPIIAENTQAETLAAYVSVLPEGTTTDSMTAIDGLTTASVEGAVKTANGDVAISGISIDGSTQTTGIGSKVSGDSFASGFIGWNGGEVASGSPVDSIAGATYSSNGAFNAINAAIDCYNNEIKGVQ